MWKLGTGRCGRMHVVCTCVWDDSDFGHEYIGRLGLLF
jgi:hypothetical protein